MHYKRIYSRLKAGDAIDASIPMHEEGCMPQAAALSMSLPQGTGVGLLFEGTSVLNYSNPLLNARCSGEKIHGFNWQNNGEMDSGVSLGAEGWKDVLQLLRERSEKIEVLARALSVNQQGMLRNNSDHVKDSVNEATE